MLTCSPPVDHHAAGPDHHHHHHTGIPIFAHGHPVPHVHGVVGHHHHHALPPIALPDPNARLSASEWLPYVEQQYHELLAERRRLNAVIGRTEQVLAGVRAAAAVAAASASSGGTPVVASNGQPVTAPPEDPTRPRVDSYVGPAFAGLPPTLPQPMASRSAGASPFEALAHRPRNGLPSERAASPLDLPGSRRPSQERPPAGANGLPSLFPPRNGAAGETAGNNGGGRSASAGSQASRSRSRDAAADRKALGDAPSNDVAAGQVPPPPPAQQQPLPPMRSRPSSPV